MAYSDPPPFALVMLSRLLLAAVFVFSALDKSLHFSDAVQEFQALGLPTAPFITLLVILLQGVGSALLLFPRTAWIGAILLATFTLGATLIAHNFWRQTGVVYTHELTTFLEHLAIVGGLILAGMPTSKLLQD